MTLECYFCYGCGETFDQHGVGTKCSHCNGTGWVLVEPKSDRELEEDRCGKEKDKVSVL